MNSFLFSLTASVCDFKKLLILALAKKLQKFLISAKSVNWNEEEKKTVYRNHSCGVRLLRHV